MTCSATTANETVFKLSFKYTDQLRTLIERTKLLPSYAMARYHDGQGIPEYLCLYSVFHFPTQYFASNTVPKGV